MITKDDLREVGLWTRNFLESLNEDERHWQHSLCGACAIGAWLNQQLINALTNIKADFVMGSKSWACHCWTEFPYDGETYVIDSTATQFGYELGRVVLMPKREYEVLPHIDEYMYKLYVNERGMEKLQAWPRTQSPRGFVPEMQRLFPGIPVYVE